MPPRRPFSVTLLLWLVLFLSAWGAIRFVAALRWWNVLNEFDARLSPTYLAATGIIWTIIGIVLLWGIFTRRAWSRVAVLASVVAWQVQVWIERLMFESQVSNIPFVVTVSLLLLGVIIGLTIHKSTRSYLHKSEEHEQPEQHPKIERS